MLKPGRSGIFSVKPRTPGMDGQGGRCERGACSPSERTPSDVSRITYESAGTSVRRTASGRKSGRRTHGHVSRRSAAGPIGPIVSVIDGISAPPGPTPTLGAGTPRVTIFGPGVQLQTDDLPGPQSVSVPSAEYEPTCKFPFGVERIL